VRPQTALFNFESLLLVILLIICTCTYARGTAPGLIDRNKNGCVPLSAPLGGIARVRGCEVEP